ncbi:MAG: ABC transporter permease [Aliidongia sp.]
MSNLQRIYTENPGKLEPLRFLCRGERYRFWGLVESDRHLFCPAEGGTLFLLGTDRLGRDMLSRLIYGTRVSLTIGLLGVALSFALGITIGGFAGYYGGWVDTVSQRVIEIIRSLPGAAAMDGVVGRPAGNLEPAAGLFRHHADSGAARLDRPCPGRTLEIPGAARRDFVQAAWLMGASPARIVFRHMLPSFASHLIASATLAIPSILGETALSFLGLGLRAPIASWGVLLNEALNINVVVLYPWLLLPVLPVLVTVLAFNFLGDGLRDAADPYQ